MAKSVSNLKKMQRNQLKSMTKDELIDSILAPDPAEDTLQTVTAELTALRTEIATLKDTITSPESIINKKVNDLQAQLNKQAEIISKQQKFLENIDRRERECNLVLFGVPDDSESLDGATTDDAKVRKVWEAAGATSNVRSIRRLGGSSNVGSEQQNRRPRILLVTVTSRMDRDAVLERAKRLKNGTDAYKKIYIKKDLHPSVREEWRRLREVERKEKGRPENVGCNIYLDARQRKIYKDGVVIDEWSQQGF